MIFRPIRREAIHVHANLALNVIKKASERAFLPNSNALFISDDFCLKQAAYHAVIINIYIHCGRMTR